MPIEETRFYRTTIPAGTLAWRLWLKNSSGQDWNNTLSVRKASLPTDSSFDKRFTAQNLLTEDFVDPGSSENYYIRVDGTAGTEFELDSRQQQIDDISYGQTIATQSFSDGFRFKTYRVQVPVDQVAWESTATPSAGTPRSPSGAIKFPTPTRMTPSRSRLGLCRCQFNPRTASALRWHLLHHSLCSTAATWDLFNGQWSRRLITSPARSTPLVPHAMAGGILLLTTLSSKPVPRLATGIEQSEPRHKHCDTQKRCSRFLALS